MVSGGVETSGEDGGAAGPGSWVGGVMRGSGVGAQQDPKDSLSSVGAGEPW